MLLKFRRVDMAAHLKREIVAIRADKPPGADMSTGKRSSYFSLQA
jgi:hypothetical protein